jgi:hypothetical protein
LNPARAASSSSYARAGRPRRATRRPTASCNRAIELSGRDVGRDAAFAAVHERARENDRPDDLGRGLVACERGDRLDHATGLLLATRSGRGLGVPAERADCSR